MSENKNKDLEKEMQDVMNESDRYAEISKILKGTKEEPKQIVEEDKDKFDPFDGTDIFDSYENEDDYTLNAGEFDDLFNDAVETIEKVESIKDAIEEQQAPDIEIEQIELEPAKEEHKHESKAKEISELEQDVETLNIIIEALSRGSEIGLKALSDKIISEQKRISNEIEYLNYRLYKVEQKLNKNVTNNEPNEPIQDNQELELNKGSESSWQRKNVKKNVQTALNQEIAQNVQNVQKQTAHVLNNNQPIIKSSFSYAEQVLIDGKEFIVVGESTTEDGPVYIVEDITNGETLIIEPDQISKKQK